MKITIKGKKIVPAITLVHYRNNGECLQPAYWNCGWHVGGRIYSHAAFQRIFEKPLSSEVMHQPDPTEDKSSPQWRRAIDHIWYSHPKHGKVISRVNDGFIAIIRDPDTDGFVAKVPMKELTEVPKFPSTRKPDSYHTRSRCIPVEKKKKPSTRKPKLTEQQLRDALASVGIDLDTLMK